MKIISYFLFIIQVLLFASCNSTSDKKVLTKELIEREQIKRSKIKSRTIFYFPSADDMTNLVKTISIFDSLGNKIKETEYSPTGEICVQSELKHDKEGNEMIGFQYRADGSILGKYITKYDAEGRTILSDWIYKYKIDNEVKQQIQRTTYSYDNLGRELQSFYTNEVGEPAANNERIVYKYSENSLEIGFDKFVNGRCDYKIFNLLSKDGRLERSDEYAFLKDSILIKKTLMKYDSNGNLSEKYSLNRKEWRPYSGFLLSTVVYFKYDNKNNLLEEIKTTPIKEVEISPDLDINNQLISKFMNEQQFHTESITKYTYEYY